MNQSALMAIKEKSQTPVPPLSQPPVWSSLPLKLLCQHQTGHCEFCSGQWRWLIAETNVACLALVRGKKTASLWEQQRVLVQGICGCGRWSEQTRGWGTAGDTAESSCTGCSNHTPAEPFPKCKIWSSPNGTKSERNLEDRAHLWKVQWTERRWVYKLLPFPCWFLLKFLLQQLMFFAVCSMLVTRQIPSNLWPE